MTYRQRRVPYQVSCAMALPSEFKPVYDMLSSVQDNVALLRRFMSIATDSISDLVYGMSRTKGKSGGKGRTHKSGSVDDTSKSKKKKNPPPQKWKKR